MHFTYTATFVREENALQWRTINTRFTLKVPLRLRILILIVTSCLLVLIIPLTFSKSREAPTDMFANYVDFFPGQYWSTGLENTFRCNVDISSKIKYCFLDKQKGLFANIGLTIIDSRITRTVFILRENAVKAGNIAILWGRPKIQFASNIVYLDWHDQKISAIGRTNNGRFDYFLRVSSVIFY